jgi:CubicO group peptidase (beta-lactamase class C family)
VTIAAGDLDHGQAQTNLPGVLATTQPVAPPRLMPVTNARTVAPLVSIATMAASPLEARMALKPPSSNEAWRTFPIDSSFSAINTSTISMPTGMTAMASGLRLRPRDTAKLGRLLLTQGSWKGRQVAPASWIAESTQPRMAVDSFFRYGYQWWNATSRMAGQQ